MRFPAEAHRFVAHIFTVPVAFRGNRPVKGGITVTQSDLPSLLPLPLAGCGRLQRRAGNWATSVALLLVI